MSSFPKDVDPKAAVQTFGLSKGYSSKLKSMQGTGAQRQLTKVLSMIRGSRVRDIRALDDVTLRVEAGSIFGLLGQNGAGKTTLIKVLSTLILPEEGRAYVHGIDVVRQPRLALRKLQTALSNESGFEWRLTGRQNLEIYAELYDIPREEGRARIEELLDLIGITEYADRNYNKYSTGTQKKFVVCRVLLSNAPVLIFDEPTSGLDPLAAYEFRKMLKQVLVKEQGKTILMASHNLWEVQQMCDSVAVLNKGRVVSQGSPAQVREIVADTVDISIVCQEGNGSTSSQIQERLEDVRGVVRSETIAGSSKGLTTMRIEGNADLDYLGLFEALVASKLKIKSFETSNPSLEDAFIKLTGEENS